MKTVYKLLLLLLLSSSLWATGASTSWYSLTENKKVNLNVELFLSSVCPHCQKEDAFFKEIATTNPDLNLTYHVINEDKNALILFDKLLNEQNMDDFIVPSVFFCNSRWVGFTSAATTGKDLMQALNYCKEQIAKEGTLTQSTIDTLRHWANANKFDSALQDRPSDFAYISGIAITDALAPCALFSLAVLFAFLFIGKERSQKIIAGALVIFAIALAHYLQQVFTSVYYTWLPNLRIPALLVSLFLLYFLLQYYKKRSQNAAYFTLAFFTGLIVTMYQQTCIMNWSFMFQQWLGNQSLSPVQHAFYQVAYQFFYIFLLLGILFLYAVLLKIPRIAAMQTRLAGIGFLILLAVAIVLLGHPMAFSSLVSSALLLLVVIVSGFWLNLT